MLTFDARTVVLVAFLTISLLFIVLFALHRSLATPLAGLRQGVRAAFSWSLGSGLILLRGSVPDFLSIVVGNMAVSGGILLIFCALALSTDRCGYRSYRIVATAALGSFAIAGLFFLGNYTHLALFATAYNATLFFACFVLVGNAKPKSFSTGFTALALCTASLASAARFVVTAVGSNAPTGAYDPIFFQRAYLSILAFMLVATLLGFALITYERINKMLLKVNLELESQVAARTADLTLEIERKQFFERLVASTADVERRRIGTELHDDVGQRLTGITLLAELLSRELSDAKHALAQHAETIQRAASDTIVQVRALAHGLMPVGPDPSGFSDALKLLATTSTMPGFDCKFEEGKPVKIKDQDVATNLFRIAQQAISNAIRHAKARSVTMKLEAVNGKVVFSIADDGSGFPLRSSDEPHGNGQGLGIMEFRAALIQYQINIKSTPGQGSTIRVAEC